MQWLVLRQILQVIIRFLYFSQRYLVCPGLQQYVHTFLSLRNLNLSCMGTFVLVHSLVECEPWQNSHVRLAPMALLCGFVANDCRLLVRLEISYIRCWLLLLCSYWFHFGLLDWYEFISVVSRASTR